MLCLLQRALISLPRGHSYGRVFLREGFLTGGFSYGRVFAPEGFRPRGCSYRRVFAPEGVLTGGFSPQRVFLVTKSLSSSLGLFLLGQVAMTSLMSSWSSRARSVSENQAIKIGREECKSFGFGASPDSILY